MNDIVQAIEKVDAACPCHNGGLGCAFAGPKTLTCRCQHGSFRCCWPGHRLVREVALTVHTRVLQRVSDMQGRKIDLVPEGVDAALSLELGDDDEQG